MVSFRKCVPWSLVRLLRHPNLEIMFSKINLVAVSIVQSLMGVSSAHLVKYFVAVIMYLARECLVGGIMGPMKSIAHFSKIHSMNLV